MLKMVLRLLTTSLALVFVACGGTKPPTENGPPPVVAKLPARPATSISATATPSAPTHVDPALPTQAPASPARPAVDAGPPFPPDSFAPPFSRTAIPTDGTYTLIEDGAAGATQSFARTLVHPHPTKPHASVVIVAVDLRRVNLVLVAGTEEPESTVVPKERRPGLVPAADLPALLAVFNGGFMAKHGKFGMMVNGEELLPAKPDGCLVAILDDGSIKITSPTALEPMRARIRSFRQTPPCLIEEGVTHPKLPQEDTARLWGAAIGGNREIRRTALGIDASGKTLLFGIGEWIWAKDLATAMKAAGAVSAAELDINWSYTRFLLYNNASPPEVVSTLIEKVEYSKTGYVTKPVTRDFFYLKKKDTGL